MSAHLDRDTVQRLIEEIEVIISSHLIWIRQLNQALHFDTSQLEDSTRADAHLKTPFGQWYYSAERHPLADFPDYDAMGVIQKGMHEAAATLFRDSERFGRINEEDFDLAMTLALNLNTSLRGLQMEIVGELLATDPLTGCLGRRGMLDKLLGEQERAQRLGKVCCIALMDFDHFKKINDERGHQAGDAALKQGMKFIQSHLRKYDSLFRYGGEEFLLCLPDTPMQVACNIVERLRSGIEYLKIIPPDGQAFNITASFGLVELSKGRSVEASIDAADQALYKAKRGGRNWVEVEEQGLRFARSDLAAFKKAGPESVQAVLNSSTKIFLKVDA